MQIVTGEKVWEDLSVYFFVLNEKNIILSCSLSGLSKEQDIVGNSITSLFDEWEESPSSKLVHATNSNQTYIFLRLSINDVDNRLYIGIENDELKMLKEENEKLKMFNRELDTIIENSYDGIYITDRQGITLNTNSAIERITGIPREYYIGKSVNALIERGILKNSVTQKVIALNRTVSIMQKNFEGNETLLTGSPVYDENGEIEKVVTNIRDLSDLYELQSELVKLNKLNDKYKKELDRLKNKPDNLKGIVTKSEEMKMIYDTADRIADIDATVLILGETGVGKDVLANFIYANSGRSKRGEFIKVNCGAIPGDLLESELFGYESGAFTGASTKGKQGMFELADQGMIFLDEIGELPLSLQVKLLRVIQEGEIIRIGGTKPKKIDTRVITATNRDLKRMVEEGTFREDLYYRLNVIPIHIPPLRERQDDLLPMIDAFLKEMNEKYQMQKELDYNTKNFFLSYHWPGNIRELSNLIERLVVTTPVETISMEYLPPEYLTDGNYNGDQLVSLQEAVEMTERKVLIAAAEKFSNTYEIAKSLDSSQPTIVRKLKKYNIKLSEYRGGN